MPGHRVDRVTEDIKREISDIIRNLKDPRIKGIVTVIRVECTQDLSYAKVYVSALGSDPSELEKGLNSATGFVRHELSSRIHIRKTPEIKFIADNSIEQSFKIAKLIDEVNKN
jgi:ribosome-binding factor A